MESATTEHLDEGDVIRILDGEATEEEHAVWAGHLRSCESCRRLHAEVEQQSAWFRSAATLLDPSAAADDLTKARALAALRAARRGNGAAGGSPEADVHAGGRRSRLSLPSRSGGAWYRLAAAAVVVIVFVGITVEPVRAWISRNVLAIASPVEDTATDDTPAPSTPLPAPAAASARFSARGPVFRIDLDQRQPAGTLTIRLTSEEQASAGVVGETGEGLVVVLPSGLRVENTSGSTASYVVELPAGAIREVVVRVGNEPLASRTLSAAGDEVELDLATGSVVP